MLDAGNYCAARRAGLIGRKPPVGWELNPEHPLNRGLVLDLLMNEGGGTPHDLSKYGNHGTLPGGTADPVWRSGRIGQALGFDGTDDYLDLGDILNSLTLPVSFSFFMEMDTLTADRAIFTSDDNSGIYYGFLAQVKSDGTIYVEYGDGGGYSVDNRRTKASASGKITTEKWYHIVGVISGATDMQIYIDGADVGGTYSGNGGSMLHSSDPFVIGKRTVWNDFLDGALDGIRLYDWAFSAAEAEWLYDIQLRGGAELYRPRRKVGYFFLPAGVTITVTKMGLSLAEQTLYLAEAPTIAKTAATWTGKPIYTAEAPTVAKGAVTWTGKPAWAAEAPRITKAGLSWTGKNALTKFDVTMQITKAALSWVGKSVATGVMVTVTVLSLAWNGGAVFLKETLIIATAAVAWTGKTLIILSGATLTITKAALSYTGKSIYTAVTTVINKLVLSWSGKAVSFAGGVISRGLSRLGLTIKEE